MPVRILILLALSLLAEQALAVSLRPVSEAWMRTSDALEEIKISPKGLYIAFRSAADRHLKIMDLKTKNIYLVTKNEVGSSFFWAPGDFRLIYKEMGKKKENGEVLSRLYAFECNSKKNILIDSYQHITGTLTFDPRENKFYLLHDKGIHSKKLYYPDNRLARWQNSFSSNNGKWVTAPKGILWISREGMKMQNFNSDNSDVASFDISPDGNAITWATSNGDVYVNYSGKKNILVGKGRSPNWHPFKNMIVYSGARMVGKSVTGYDLRVYDHNSRSKWITETSYSHENWPQWSPDGKEIIFTKEKTTDVYTMVFMP